MENNLIKCIYERMKQLNNTELIMVDSFVKSLLLGRMNECEEVEDE